MATRRRLLACGLLFGAISNSVLAQSYGSWVDPPRSAQRNLLAAGAASQSIGALADGTMPGGSIPCSPQTHSALRRRLERLRVSRLASESTLEDLVRQLNALGIPTIADERSLADESVGPSDPVRIPFADLPLGEGLTAALRSIDCTWTFTESGSAMVITTRERNEEELIAITYDVTRITRGDQYDSLINTITSTVEPDAWDDVGGPGTVQPIDVRSRRLLVISADFHTHSKVRRLLNTLLRMGGSGSWTAPATFSSQYDRVPTVGSSVISMPNKPKKRGIALHHGKPGSTSNFGGFGGGMMGGMGGGMF